MLTCQRGPLQLWALTVITGKKNIPVLVTGAMIPFTTASWAITVTNVGKQCHEPSPKSQFSEVFL